MSPLWSGSVPSEHRISDNQWKVMASVALINGKIHWLSQIARWCGGEQIYEGTNQIQHMVIAR
ncbi:hypothetical protein Pth03_82340 [Planotetraspora thailandica]|uniref:Transposase n=1 Tax=Planotetraspora thailandica TaxID=487172 RepID=A0A8J3Y372_9ACTN|nr:hypothetical protein Pth03_82340 [Planotetraspora thailandica]